MTAQAPGSLMLLSFGVLLSGSPLTPKALRVSSNGTKPGAKLNLSQVDYQPLPIF